MTHEKIVRNALNRYFFNQKSADGRQSVLPLMVMLNVQVAMQEGGGHLTVADIHKNAAGFSPLSVSRSIDELVERGFLDKLPDDSDRRVRRLVTTPASVGFFANLLD
jgi:hypothetical protein